jgi:3-hydroxyacyl-CoA dehydrogenase/enoyl-CoA hydratase/3-hydroxybutyryl-CoA epimerase
METSHAAKPVFSILGSRDLELGPFAIDEAAQEGGSWANWRMRTDEDGIAWLLFDKRNASTQWLKDKVAKGELGKKTGKGLYHWKDGDAVKSHDAGAPPPRLILPMLDVCITCLREGIVADKKIIDGAMIFATGFAPFRGGPMDYARSRGTAEVRDTLKRLGEKYGPHFQPDPGWDNLQ